MGAGRYRREARALAALPDQESVANYHRLKSRIKELGLEINELHPAILRGERQKRPPPTYADALTKYNRLWDERRELRIELYQLLFPDWTDQEIEDEADFVPRPQLGAGEGGNC